MLGRPVRVLITKPEKFVILASSYQLIRTLVVGTLFLAGCQSASTSNQAPTGRSVGLVGASVGRDGFATIVDAPPAPVILPETTPAPPPRLSENQRAAGEQFARVGQFQNEIRNEVQSLVGRLRQSEPQNFVDLYYENDGAPHVVFRFLRQPRETLGRYTRNPKFVAAKADYSKEELRAAHDFMWRTFQPDRVIQASAMRNKANRVEVDISVAEAEFRALVAKKGVTIPEAVTLRFLQSLPATLINIPLSPKIAPLIRIFLRDDRPAGILHSIMSQANVVLDDGCFRIKGGIHNTALAVFPLGAQIFIDREGYLAFGDGEKPGYARVAEELVFPGSIGEVSARELVEPIKRACGPGKVVKINGMNSAAAYRAGVVQTDNH